jgi:hypothetical protein
VSSAAICGENVRFRQDCVRQADYSLRGGKFIHAAVPDFSFLESHPDLFSKRGSIFGEFGGYIDDNGIPVFENANARGLSYPTEPEIDGFRGGHKPEERLYWMTKAVQTLRYQPPILHGNRVCVFANWLVTVGPRNIVVTP